MVFIRYQHVERIDSDEVEGLLDGTCHVFPKMDGSNMCVYSEDGVLRTMSRNVALNGREPFARFAEGHDGICRFVRDFPGIRLYGEWMVPHTVRSYVPEVWNRWFVFDMMAEDPDAEYAYTDAKGRGRTLRCGGRTYIPYSEYVPVLESYRIEYVPVIDVLDSPDPHTLLDMADNRNTWMIPEGCGCGEGIVVKRYDYRSKYGRVTWAKVISSAFSGVKREARMLKRRASESGAGVEHSIVVRYMTPDVVNKEYDRIRVEAGTVEPRRLLGNVWHCLVTESMWDAVKRFRNPRVDFDVLRKECELYVKVVRPEVFGLSSLDVEPLGDMYDVE